MKSWNVFVADEFEPEFLALPAVVKEEIVSIANLLKQFGPQLGRPRVDTLKGSKHANMKEMRFDAIDGVWRVAFAFDPDRAAILLVAGDKSGAARRSSIETYSQGRLAIPGASRPSPGKEMTHGSQHRRNRKNPPCC